MALSETKVPPNPETASFMAKKWLVNSRMTEARASLSSKLRFSSLHRSSSVFNFTFPRSEKLGGQHCTGGVHSTARKWEFHMYLQDFYTKNKDLLVINGLIFRDTTENHRLLAPRVRGSRVL